MVHELRLRKIGNSVGLVLPRELLAHMKAGEGDAVTVSEAPDGCLRLSPSSAEFSRQMEVVKDVIHRYRNTLRELAK